MGDRFSILESRTAPDSQGGESTAARRGSPTPPPTATTTATTTTTTSDRFPGRMEVVLLEQQHPTNDGGGGGAGIGLGSVGRIGEAVSSSLPSSASLMEEAKDNVVDTGGFCHPAQAEQDDPGGHAAAAIESTQADPTGILSSSRSSNDEDEDDVGSPPQLPQQLLGLAAGNSSGSSSGGSGSHHHHPHQHSLAHSEQQHAQQMMLQLAMPGTCSSAPPLPPTPTTPPLPLPPPTAPVLHPGMPGSAPLHPGMPGSAPLPPPLCVICNRPAEDGRPLLHFAPVGNDGSTVASAPDVQTFSQHVHLHVFCGKTASILPHVNQPDLEILSKAGLKNKHGTGPEVNAALARTRSTIATQINIKDATHKEFFLVKEFEAHLAAVRGTTISLLGLIPVASADPYGNWRGPHQQYLLEQQRREQEQRDREQLEAAGVGVGAGIGQRVGADMSHEPATENDVMLGLHPFLPSSGTDLDPEEDDPGRGDNPAVNDEADDDEEAKYGAADSMDHMNGGGRRTSASSSPPPSGVFQAGVGAGGAPSSSETTPSNDRKRDRSSPSTTSASETTEWKIPRKRLTSQSSSSTPSRDGVHHPSPSSLLGTNGAGAHFLDQPTFPYSTNGAAAPYRSTSSNLSPHIPDGDGIQPLYHSMLISSASPPPPPAPSFDPALLFGNGTVGISTGTPTGSRSVVGSDGTVRIHCVCGGRHLPRNSAKGMASWRTHFMTKRHQNWLKNQGLVGTV